MDWKMRGAFTLVLFALLAAVPSAQEEALDRQPEPEHRALTRYCPRCHATYKQGAARCVDCAEVPLHDLAIP